MATGFSPEQTKKEKEAWQLRRKINITERTARIHERCLNYPQLVPVSNVMPISHREVEEAFPLLYKHLNYM